MVTDLAPKYQVGEEVVFLGYPDNHTERKILEVGDKLVVLDCIKLNTYTVGVHFSRRATCGTKVIVFENEIGRFSDYEYDQETNTLVRVTEEDTSVVSGYLPVIDTAHPESLTDIMVQTGLTATQLACKFYNTAEKSKFLTGGFIAYAIDHKEHIALGYDDSKEGFTAYCQDHVKCGYSQARYLVNCYRKFTNLGVPLERIEKIGWTKARLIEPVATKENFEELVDFAGKHNRQELQELTKYQYSKTDVRGEKYIENPYIEKTYTRMWKMSEEDDKLVGMAISVTKKNTDFTTDSECIGFICNHFLTSNLGREVPVEQAVKLLENFYGVTIHIEK